MSIYGLVGRKLGHSFSPFIHSSLGNSEYKLFELEPEDLGAFMQREDLGGVNVTIPYKIDVMQYCDVLDETAREIGAVNTVVKRDGKLYGYNTDFIGFCRMLEVSGISVKGKKVLVLGNGGASKTAVYCCKKLGARSVTVISRSGEDNYTNLSKHADAEIIVNCTPVGMAPDNLSSPLDLDAFPLCRGVADVIYNPLRTALMMQAEKKGTKNTCGLLMLTSQGVAAHEYFMDTKVSKDKDVELYKSLRRDAENIVLIGMPGSGKSTVGKHLADICGREALECDELIAKKAGKTIPEIFAQDGEDEFRKLESEVLLECGKQKGRIIITGGGAVTRKENYPALHQNGRIYRIRRSVDLLALEGRPLSKSIDALREMEKVREPMYRAFSDVEIENIASPEETAEAIRRDFYENTGY